MSVLTQAIYDVLAGDGTLTGMLASYEGLPAIFTTDPAPGDATLPYIVSAGEVTQIPWDTKTTRGRQATRDIRVYDRADGEGAGSAVTVEAIAERVRTLFHRVEIPIDGFTVIIASADGPVAADERDAYGRIVSLTLTIQEE